jgi:hypothetical protein
MKFKALPSFLKKRLPNKLENIPFTGLCNAVNNSFAPQTISDFVLLSDGSAVFVGDFTHFINDNNVQYSCNYIVKFLSNGLIDTTFLTNIGTAFNAEANGIATDGTSLYVVGNFSSFKGVTNSAKGIAKLSTSGILNTVFGNNLDVVSGTKAATSGFNSTVNSITINGTDLYVGGSFTSFKGTANNANRIAKLSTSGVFDTTFSDNLDVSSGVKASTSGFTDGTVRSLSTDGIDLYVGGSFTSFKGTANNANRIAKLSTSGVFDTAFSNNLDVSPGVKASTSGFNLDVNSLYVSIPDVYIVGGFSQFKNTANNARSIAKLSTSGIFDTAFSNNLDVVSGVKSSATSGFNSSAASIVVSGTDLYVGGIFTQFKNVANNARSIAKLSTSGVFDTAFSDNLDVVSGTKAISSGFGGDALIRALKISGTDLFAAGSSCISFKNQPRLGIAKLTTSGSSQQYISSSFSVVRKYGVDPVIAIDSAGNRYCSAINYNGRAVGGICKVLPSGELDETFASNIGQGFNGVAKAIVIDGSNIYVGGDFTSFNGVANNARYIAKLSTSGVFDTAFSNNLDVVSGTKATTSGFNGTVYCIALDGTSLYVGGIMTSFKGGSNNAKAIAKLSTSGVFDTAFSDNLDVAPGTKAATSGFSGIVQAIAVSGTSIYVGGTFSTFKGVTNNANKIAKLSTSGVFDTAFSDNLDVSPGVKASTSGFSQSIFSIVTDGTNLYVGGNLQSFKGISNSANGIAKLSTSGVFDTAFSNNLDVVSGTKATSSGLSGEVRSIVMDGNSLYVVGSFSKFKSDTIFKNNRVIKLDILGQEDTTFTNSTYVTPGSPFNGSNAFGSTATGIALDMTTNTIVVVGNFLSYRGRGASSMIVL